MADKPYIHTFRTSEQCYVYDVNTNRILNIPDSLYKCLLTSDEHADEITTAILKDMKANGFLRSDRVEISEHPATPLLPYFLENKMQQLALQVTQRCNLRCDYCVYSGLYKTRTHSNGSMSIEVAEKAIDYFIPRTKDSRNVAVSFYGGEPLLNIDLIKHCVNYIDKKYSGGKISYSMTSNGTLLDDITISFLADLDFRLLVSLDGPQVIHDANRKFADSDEGSFSTIIQNIMRIKELFPNYYRDKVRFNAVLDTRGEYSCIEEFISCDDLFSDDMFNVNYVSDNFTDHEISFNEEFHIDREYHYFMFFLSRLGEISNKNEARSLTKQFNDVFRRCYQNIELEQEHIPPKYHHSGPCIPGVRRLFVDIGGKFYPCEQVSELSETVVIGSVETGVSLEKVLSILNIENSSHAKCKDCWAYRRCLVCIAHSEDMHDSTNIESNKKCSDVCSSIEETFLDYCVLRELGYTFDAERM